MVAIIKTGHSIQRIFYYNESKVKEGVAECIGAGNYPVDVEKLSTTMKLNRLLKQTALNENVTRNSVHISLNFDAADAALSREKLMQIADAYMQGIGFSEQPYLVYQHHDAGHPHIHLVSIKVRADGSRIDTQNIGRNQSENTRKQIEKSFDLVVADSHKRKETFRLKPVNAAMVQYGRMETKRAIQNVLDAVLEKYSYTSLPELNAVLKQYNVIADRGSEQSRIFQAGGLVYRILDEEGKPVGVPIKASVFYNKPTLKYLEEKYSMNEARRPPFKARIKNEIDRLFIGKTPALNEVVKQLERKGIHVSLRQNEAGLIYGITYVDHQNKTVFNGSALGKAYSAKGMQERCFSEKGSVQDLLTHSAVKLDTELKSQTVAKAETQEDKNASQASITTCTETILDNLLQSEQTADYIPAQLKKKRRNEKKKRNISDY